jgi:ABC-2 type transport system ATP-binding protein
MLTGLIEPSEGQILYNGQSIYEDLVGFQRRIGYVPEEAYLYPHLSGREYLQLVGRLRGIPGRTLEPKLDELLNLFTLWKDRFTSLSSYSKGMRQKILLSAALLHNPDVLILDEPFSGLDVRTALMLRRLLSGLAQRGKIILYSSHVLGTVEKVCSKVLILRSGEVVAYDSIDQLRSLMRQPSLEAVFAQLADVKDEADLADTILEVVTAKGQLTREPSCIARLTPAEKRRGEKRDFVHGERESLSQRITRLLTDVGKDFRYAFRVLAGSPGFTAVALLSLAMGVCIATCAISEMNGITLRRLPAVEKPDELVAVQVPTSYLAFKRYRDQNDRQKA